MKKFVFKATALAIGALVGGSAFAALDLTATSPTPQTTNTYASEFSYAAAADQIAAGETVKAALGFGVSAGQNRYIRLDLTGVKFGTGTLSAASAAGFDGATVVAGGAAGDSYAIIQVTGLSAGGAGNAANDLVTITLPALRTTGGNVTPTATYALYETAVAAVAAAPNTQLATPKTGNLFTFASALKFETTVGKNKALVAKSFKEFEVAGATTALLATLGEISYGIAVDANNTAIKDKSGNPATLAGLLSAANVVVAGDFTAAAAAAVYLVDKAAVAPANTCGGAGAVKLGTFDTTGKMKTTFAAGTAAKDYVVCYAVTGTKAIPAQTVTADLTPVALTGVNVVDPAAISVGQITRDGATLQAPFVTTHPDYLSRVILNSTYAADAAVELSVITKDGVTCSNSVYKTNLPAGKQIMVNVKDICGDLTGSTFFAVQAIVAATADTIQGAYNAVQYDVVTGKPGAYMSYPLVAPIK